jgi:hypothetical protein
MMQPKFDTFPKTAPLSPNVVAVIKAVPGLPGFLDRTTGRSRQDIDDLRRDLLNRHPWADALCESCKEPQRRELSVMDCFACGRSYCNGDGWFCSPRCRAAFDAGWPVYQAPVISYDLPKGRDGFLIDCAACRKQFDSKGLRCCSPECERQYQSKQKLAAKLPVAAERVVKRKCHGCHIDLPTWRNGRRVRAKFCSPRCQKRAARSAGLGPSSPDALLSAKRAKMCPKIGPSRKAVERRSAAVEQAKSREARNADPRRANSRRST